MLDQQRYGKRQTQYRKIKPLCHTYRNRDKDKRSHRFTLKDQSREHHGACEYDKQYPVRRSFRNTHVGKDGIDHCSG